MQKVLALVSLRACTVLSGASALALSPRRRQATASYHNDVSRPSREVAATYKPGPHQERQVAENPKIPATVFQ